MTDKGLDQNALDAAAVERILATVGANCNHLGLGTLLNSPGCRRAHSGDTQGLHFGMPGPPSTPWLRPMSFICHWFGATQCPRCSASGPALADVAVRSTAVPIRRSFFIVPSLRSSDRLIE